MGLSDSDLVEIDQIVNSMSDSSCVKLLNEHIESDLKLTRQVLEMKIDPLSPNSPYQPRFAGKIYIEEGISGLRNLKLDSKGLRSLIKIILETEYKLNDLYNSEANKESTSQKVEIVRAKLNLSSLRRSSFKIID